MVLHCSRKLAQRLPDVSASALAEISALGGWHGHLVVMDRRQCVLFCHDATRYVLFLPGLRKPQFHALGNTWLRHLFAASLAILGCTDTQVRKAELALGQVQYDVATDRSVQASLRVAALDLEAWLWRQVPDVMNADPLAAAHWLNQRPTRAQGQLLWPNQAMFDLISAL